MSDETKAAERPQPVVLDLEPAGLAARAEEPRRAQIVTPISERPGQTMDVSRVIVRHTAEIGELFGALALAQGKFKDLERTRTARIESAKARYAFDYETLADVIEATKEGLAENGLSVMQFPFPSRSEITIRTLLGHSSGQWIYNDLSAALDGTDPRSIGSGITYLCRYARKAILGLAADYDDDAEAASGPKDAPQAAQRRSAQAAPVPLAAVAPPAAAAPAPTGPSREGLITDVIERGGGWFVKLDSGFFAGTKVAATAETARALQAAGRRVRLDVTPPADPKKYAPWIAEIVVLTDAGQ